MQQPSLAAQTVLDRDDVPVGISLMFFANSLGGAVFVSVGQSVFVSALRGRLREIPGADVAAVLAAGATEVARVVSPGQLLAVLEACNDSLRRAFVVVVAVSCAMVLPASGMEWSSIKKKRGSELA